MLLVGSNAALVAIGAIVVAAHAYALSTTLMRCAIAGGAISAIVAESAWGARSRLRLELPPRATTCGNLTLPSIALLD